MRYTNACRPRALARAVVYLFWDTVVSWSDCSPRAMGCRCGNRPLSVPTQFSLRELESSMSWLAPGYQPLLILAPLLVLMPLLIVIPLGWNLDCYIRMQSYWKRTPFAYQSQPPCQQKHANQLTVLRNLAKLPWWRLRSLHTCAPFLQHVGCISVSACLCVVQHDRADLRVSGL